MSQKALRRSLVSSTAVKLCPTTSAQNGTRANATAASSSQPSTAWAPIALSVGGRVRMNE